MPAVPLVIVPALMRDPAPKLKKSTPELECKAPEPLINVPLLVSEEKVPVFITVPVLISVPVLKYSPKNDPLLLNVPEFVKPPANALFSVPSLVKVPKLFKPRFVRTPETVVVRKAPEVLVSVPALEPDNVPLFVSVP